MNVEIGTEAAHFPEKEYINGIFVAVQRISIFWRGLQFSKLDGMQTEIDRYLQTNKFLLVAKCLKMTVFLSICIKNFQMVHKTQTILCWFKFVPKSEKLNILLVCSSITFFQNFF